MSTSDTIALSQFSKVSTFTDMALERYNRTKRSMIILQDIFVNVGKKLDELNIGLF